MDEGKDENDKLSQGSPFSPFPYGSPLQRASPAPRQTSYTGSPAQKLLLNSLNRSASRPVNETNGEFTVTPRLKSQDMYGGPVMFGSTARRTRLLSSTPYSAAFRMRDRAKSRSMSGAGNTSLLGAGHTTLSGLGHTSLVSQGGLGSAGNSSRATPVPENPPVDSMSTTARLILDALDKMSTPIQDALKVPVARAEKRKLVQDELNSSLGASGRRRPRLGGGPNGRSPLSGPPLRKNYSPLPVAAAASRSKVTASPLSRTPRIPTPPPSAPPTPTVPSSASCTSAPSTQSTTSVPTKPLLPPAVPSPGAASLPFSLPSSSFSSSTPLPSSKPFITSTPALNPLLTSTPAPKAMSISSMAPKPMSSSSPASKPLLTSTPAPTSMKMRNKVTGRGKEDEDELAPPPPSFLLNNIPVLKVPSSLPSIPLGLPSPTSGASSGATSFKDTFRLNKPTAVVGASKEAFKSTEKSNTDIKFSFNQPMSTTPAPSSNKTVNSAERNISYTFSPPKPVQSGGLKRIENVKTVYAFAMPTPVLPELTGSETKLEELTSLGQFKSAAMPDVTNNIKSKSDNMIQGRRKDSLPDVTASTGFSFGAAKQLKGGSVMDILGGGKKF